jgi:hypothetical protein
MRKVAKPLIVTSLLATMLLSSGCWFLLGAAGGAAGAKVLGSRATSLEAVSLPRLHDASIEALKELNLVIVEDAEDAMVARIKAMTADDKEVSVKMDRITPETTEITVSVGVMGDKTRAQQILSAIRGKL